jgi:tetratricopeptide (TPR) repeat protein
VTKSRVFAATILSLLLIIGLVFFFKGVNLSEGVVLTDTAKIQKQVKKELNHSLWYKEAYQRSETKIKALLQKTSLIDEPKIEKLEAYKEIGEKAYLSKNTLISALAYKNRAELSNKDSSFLYAGNLFMEHAQSQEITAEERSYTMGSAIEMYKQSISINAKNITALNSLAVAIIQEGQSPPMLGISYLKKSLEIDSNNISTNYLYAQLLSMSTQYEKAIKIYNKLINLQPSNAEYYFSLSEIYGKIGDTQNAKELLNKAKSLNK